MSELCWIVMGTGLIADKVTPLIGSAENCRVVGVASRNLDRARWFAERHGIEHACTYQELLTGQTTFANASRRHDHAIYCTLPNRHHPASSLRLLEAGYHVLCEKPLCWRRDDAERLFGAARKAERLLVEGFMYLHHRQIDVLAAMVRDGATPIGQIRRIEAFFESDMKAVHREATRYSHNLAGGAVLDLGCYPVSFIRTVLGKSIEQVSVTGTVAEPLAGETLGVDERVEVEGRSGQVSFRLVCGIDHVGQRCVRLIGEFGEVSTDWPWAPDPDRAELQVTRSESHPRGAGHETIVIERGGDKFVNQFARFAAAVRGECSPLPSPVWSIDQASAIERILADVGVDYGPGLDRSPL